MPGCTTATQQAAQLPAADVAMAAVPGGLPFGVVAAPGGRWAFVALGGEVGVLRTAGRGVPSLSRQVSIRLTIQGWDLLGDTITPDGRYLLVADAGTGAVVFSARAAEHGSPHSVLGILSGPPEQGLGPRGQGGAIEVAVSPDGAYAFVSLEYADKIAVFRLQRALGSGFGRADYVGSIPTQLAHSVISRVLAGCNPVRVVISPDGKVVWVTARASDALLAFSASRSGPTPPTPCWPQSGSARLQSGWPSSATAPGSWWPTPTGSALAVP